MKEFGLMKNQTKVTTIYNDGSHKNKNNQNKGYGREAVKLALEFDCNEMIAVLKL